MIIVGKKEINYLPHPNLSTQPCLLTIDYSKLRVIHEKGQMDSKNQGNRIETD